MLSKRGKIIIVSVTISLIVSLVIFDFVYGRRIGNLWQKDTQFTTNDNRLFYNITKESCNEDQSDLKINFFQDKSTVYFEIQSITAVLLDTLDYSITRINGNLTLHIIGYWYSGTYCLHKFQISGYLIFYLDQIDAVDLSYIYRR